MCISCIYMHDLRLTIINITKRLDPPIIALMDYTHLRRQSCYNIYLDAEDLDTLTIQ